MSSSQTPYSCGITTGVGITDVIIANSFSDNFFENNITATINANTITIAPQVPDSDEFKVSATGNYFEGKLTWNYTLTNTGNTSLNYTGNWYYTKSRKMNM